MSATPLSPTVALVTKLVVGQMRPMRSAASSLTPSGSPTKRRPPSHGSRYVPTRPPSGSSTHFRPTVTGRRTWTERSSRDCLPMQNDSLTGHQRSTRPRFSPPSCPRTRAFTNWPLVIQTALCVMCDESGQPPHATGGIHWDTNGGINAQTPLYP
jgi:hypothetical protein